MIQLGSPAPSFRTRDQHNAAVALEDFRGRTVLLVFFPWAFSGICSGELCALRDDLPRLQAGDAQVLAVSTDALYALRTFADAEGLDFPVLTDHWPHGAVASAYGVFDEEVGVARRGTFVIDPDGVVRFAEVAGLGDRRDVGRYADIVAAVTSGAHP